MSQTTAKSCATLAAGHAATQGQPVALGLKILGDLKPHLHIVFGHALHISG